MVATLEADGVITGTDIHRRNIRRVVARYLTWIARQWDMPITLDTARDLLRDNGSIRTWTQAHEATHRKGTINTYRRAILSVSRAANRRYGEVTIPGIELEDTPAINHPGAHNRDTSTAYTYDELRQIDDWVQSRPRAPKRRDIAAAVALALGAGLTSEEIFHTTYADFATVGDYLTVTTRGGRGTRPRTIPITAPYDEQLADIIDDSDPATPTEPLIRPTSVYRTPGHKHPERMISEMITSAANYGTPGLAPNVYRLRYSWLADHAYHRVPVDAVIELCGINLDPNRPMTTFHSAYHHIIVNSDYLTEPQYWDWINATTAGQPDYQPLHLV